MLVDLLCDNAVGTYSLRLARVFGIPCASYIRCVAGMYRDAVRLGKVDSSTNEFTVDRSEIDMRTAVPRDSQLEFDSALGKTGVLVENADDMDKVRLDVGLLASISSDDDLSCLKSLTKTAGVVHQKATAELKSKALCNRLKASLVCSNAELLEALSGWIDSAMAINGKPLSKEVVKLFQDGVNKYAKGDLDVALRIIRIATIQGYRNSDWAIASYEREINRSHIADYQSVRNPVRRTVQKRATATSISETTF